MLNNIVCIIIVGIYTYILYCLFLIILFSLKCSPLLFLYKNNSFVQTFILPVKVKRCHKNVMDNNYFS